MPLGFFPDLVGNVLIAGHLLQVEGVFSWTFDGLLPCNRIFAEGRRDEEVIPTA
jgi:hypothetical protein